MQDQDSGRAVGVVMQSAPYHYAQAQIFLNEIAANKDDPEFAYPQATYLMTGAQTHALLGLLSHFTSSEGSS